MKLGDLPSWIEALATVLALAAAVYAGIHAARLLRIETDRDRKREEMDRRQQASLVAAWRGVGPVYIDKRGNDDGRLGPIVRNGSELPIYKVKVEMLRSEVKVFTTDVLAPGQWFIHPNGRFYPLRPATRRNEGRKAAPYFGVAISFRDAAGTECRRDENGNLRHTGNTFFPEPATVEVTPGELVITQGGLGQQGEPGQQGGPGQQQRWTHPWFSRRKRAPNDAGST